jgi:hypothetical protein
MALPIVEWLYFEFWGFQADHQKQFSLAREGIKTMALLRIQSQLRAT